MIVFILQTVANVIGCFIVVLVIWAWDQWNRGAYDRARKRADADHAREQAQQKRRR